MIKITKPLTKETNLKLKDKPVSITLTPEGDIVFKAKHARNDYRISVEELFNNLAGLDKKEKPKPKKDDKMISLSHLRSMNAVLDLDYKTKVKFEDLILKTLKENDY